MTEKPGTGRRTGWLLGCGLLIGLVAAFTGHQSVNYTSTDTFCNQACHSHPHATRFWFSPRTIPTGTALWFTAQTAICPQAESNTSRKRPGWAPTMPYAQMFRDVSKVDWARERKLDRAVTFTYDASCIRCHSKPVHRGALQHEGKLPSGDQETDAHQVREMKIVARRMEATSTTSASGTVCTA